MSLDKINKIQKAMQRLERQKNKVLNAALNSDDPVLLFKAQQELAAIQPREEAISRKSYLTDPFDFQASLGYKNRATNMSYSLLQSMGRTPVINAIIRTRINQIASFSKSQKDKYSLGFVIEKKKKSDDKMSMLEEQEIELLTEFVLNCGINPEETSDDFEDFLRKIVRDSLTYDQMTWETTWAFDGIPHGFYATDASTFRIADSYDDQQYKYYQSEEKALKREALFGYYPSYVQLYQGNVWQDFYPWELCFGVRNPTTDIRQNGYGTSELEELTTTVTSLLWGEEYNRNFFKQGSAPKGMLKVKGNMGKARMQEFRQQWNATMKGVWNSWRTPMVEADQVDWVDLQKSNRDMEFNNWIEYLIKLSCAIFTIDPAEVNFPLSGSSGQSFMFEGNNEQRLKHSKDKGLMPLLRFFEKKINYKILRHFFGGKYRLKFVGLDAVTPEKELEMDTKAVQNYETVNEVRARRGLPPIDGGDIILNAQFMQGKQMEQQAEMFGGGGGEGEGDSSQEDIGEDFSQEDNGEDSEYNPFEKAFENYLKKF